MGMQVRGAEYGVSLNDTLSVVAIVAVLRGYTGSKIEGYRVKVKNFSQSNSQDCVRDIDAATVANMLRRGNILLNAELDSSLEVKITQGALSAYPVVDPSTGALRGKNGLTLMYAIVDENNDTVGYGCCDGTGKFGQVSEQRLIRLSSSYLPTNWELYSKQSGGKGIRMKSGTLRKVQILKREVVQSYNSALESKEDVERKMKENAAALSANETVSKMEEDVASANLSAAMKLSADTVRTKEYAIFDELAKKMEEFDKTGVLPDGLSLSELKAKLADARNAYIKVAEERAKELLVDSGSGSELPALYVRGLNDTSIHPRVSTDAQKFMLQVANNLNIVSPYYASMYSAIPKSFTMAIPTMAVSEDHMFINPSFLLSLSIAEATFVYIHEMLHIAMQHSARHGKRDNELWNIACDLYINELICRDFGITFGDPNEKEFTIKNGDRTYRGVIKCLDFGVFLSTIGESLDFARDTVERIYSILYKENPPQQGSGGQGQEQQGQGQQSSGGQGQQGQQSSGEQGQQSSGGQEQGQQRQQSAGSQASGESSDGSEQGGQQSGQGQGSQGSESGNESNGQGGNQGGSQGDWSSQGSSVSSSSTFQDDIASSNIDDFRNKTVTREIIYKGKKMAVTTTMDVTESKETAEARNNGDDANQKSWGSTRDAVTRIITKRKMQEDKTGKKCCKTSGEALVERSMDFAAAKRVNWEAILKNMANSKPKKTYLMSKPNRVYMNMGTTVATRQHVGKKTMVKGLKICVDVSGSVTEVELNRVFTKVAQILDTYKVEAEMIYWDTQITNVGTFTDLRGMLAVKPLGCGGTDARCIFDFLSHKTRWQGHTEEDPIKDISCVIIFTDGCFSRNFDDYARAFGRKVVWVIDDAAPPFKPPFGVVAVDKLS